MSKAEADKTKLHFSKRFASPGGPIAECTVTPHPTNGDSLLVLSSASRSDSSTAYWPGSSTRSRPLFFMAQPPRERNHSSLIANYWKAGPRINSIVWICLAIPLVMTMRSLCSYGNAYYMNWVSNKVVTDIRNQLFSKIVRHSMDFFNRMQTGFLMSRISNDTRSMQAALTSISGDVFKQPVTIVSTVTILLLLDWKFTVVTLILFPICILPIRLFGRRARQAVQREQKGMGLMSVTMQESFAGIRVIKSFTRGEPPGKVISTQLASAVLKRDAPGQSGRSGRAAR